MPCKGYHKKNPKNRVVVAYISEEEHRMLCEVKAETKQSFSKIVCEGIEVMHKKLYG